MVLTSRSLPPSAKSSSSSRNRAGCWCSWASRRTRGVWRAVGRAMMARIEDHRQLDGEEPLGADGGAGCDDVLGRDEVRVRPGRAVAGEFEHPGPSAARTPLGAKPGPVEAIKVLHHPGVRLAIVGAATFHHHRVAGAETEQEPAGMRLLRRPGRTPPPRAATSARCSRSRSRPRCAWSRPGSLGNGGRRSRRNHRRTRFVSSRGPPTRSRRRWPRPDSR